MTRKRRTTKKPVDADEGDAVKEPADAGETATMETAGADDEAKPQEATETPEQTSEVAADGETSADDRRPLPRPPRRAMPANSVRESAATPSQSS